MVALLCDLNSLSKSRHNILGEICLEVGEEYFPSNGWDDFVVVIVGWWLSAAGRLLNPHSESNSEEFYFMDGPHHFRITKVDEMHWELQLFPNRQEGNSIVIDSAIFCEQLENLKNSLIAACYQNNWQGDDVLKLKEFKW